MGYTDEYRRQLCKQYLAQGFDAFKLKVGQNLADDIHRCRLVREEIGWKNKLVRKLCFDRFEILSLLSNLKNIECKLRN